MLCNLIYPFCIINGSKIQKLYGKYKCILHYAKFRMQNAKSVISFPSILHRGSDEADTCRNGDLYNTP